MDYLTSEAPPTTADGVQILTIVAICILFCFCIRHLNDFFIGETVTLVEEGTWGGRFKHRNEYKELRKVEDDFAKMYYEITKGDEHRASIKSQRAREAEKQLAYNIDTDNDD